MFFFHFSRKALVVSKDAKGRLSQAAERGTDIRVEYNSAYMYVPAFFRGTLTKVLTNKSGTSKSFVVQGRTDWELQDVTGIL